MIDGGRRRLAWLFEHHPQVRPVLHELSRIGERARGKVRGRSGVNYVYIGLFILDQSMNELVWHLHVRTGVGILIPERSAIKCVVIAGKLLVA